MFLTLAILFGLLSAFLGWKLIGMRKGIRVLTGLLQSDAVSSSSIQPESVRSNSLAELSRTALNAVAESSLERDSESYQRQFLQILLDEIENAILIINADGTIRFANKATHRFFPSDLNLIGRDFISVCLDHRFLEILAEVLRSETRVRREITHRTGDETKRTHRDEIWQVEAEVMSVPHREADGTTWFHIRDITNEKETEQIRRDFVANASHELRTPLSIITGYIETLSENELDLKTDFSKRALKTMEVHGERISRIVDDMLTISKLERFDDLLKRKSFNLMDSIETMISHLKPLIEEQKAKVKIDADERADWPLFGDRYYWDQIFFNLIENSLKQNQTASKLVVTVKLREVEGEYHLSVCDNGVGVPSSDLPLIFKRFYRVEKHHARTVKGTGLGLSIVKRAVESHQGSIKVESRPGVLTCFQITVPVPGK